MKIVLAPRSGENPPADIVSAYPNVEFVPAQTADDVASLLVSADAYFGQPSREAFLGAKKLRWIQSPSAGVEWMWKIPEISGSDVVVTNARGAHAATIAEHTFAMLLTFTRAIRFYDAQKARHSWVRGQMEQPTEGIVGKTIGIVGLGNIGRAIAQRAHAFEMRVLAVDAQPVTPPSYVESCWLLDRLHDMIRQVDVLVVAAPITPETRGMIGAAELALLKPSAYLLVESRGGIVDEPSLVAALREKRIAGAGLDVTAVEPLPAESPLWDLENIIITPHISGTSNLTTALMWSIFKENIGHFVKGEPLSNTVSKQLGY